jgi:hypothetical protein
MFIANTTVSLLLAGFCVLCGSAIAISIVGIVRSRKPGAK